MGRLVLVPTPLGNLGDITDRAKTALVEADVVLAEDTRTTGKLLKLLGLEAKLRPYHMHNEHAQAEALVQLVASSAGHVALASDAGTPGISDPGFLLVRACIQAGLTVEALPGPTARRFPALRRSPTRSASVSGRAPTPTATGSLHAMNLPTSMPARRR